MMKIKLDLEKYQKEYSQASPWPHCVIDGAWPTELLSEMAQEWPDSNHSSWRHVGAIPNGRYRNQTPSTFPLSVQKAFSYLSSPELKAQVGKIIGHKDLFTDPDCSLLEGMHLNSSGTALGLHQDCLWNERVQGYRVANLLLYLNPEWEEDNQGELVLWDPKTKTPVSTVAPFFNRTVLMAVNEDTIHGTWPAKNRDRKSLAVYYYVSESPGPKNSKRAERYFEWL